MGAAKRAKWETRQQTLEQLKCSPDGLTPLQAAVRFGNYKLSTYANDLIAAGYPIKKLKEPIKNRRPTVRYKYVK